MVTICFACDCQINQTVDQLWIRNTAGSPKLWIHTDLSEPRDGVHFVQENPVAVPIQQKINPGQPAPSMALNALTASS